MYLDVSAGIHALMKYVTHRVGHSDLYVLVTQKKNKQKYTNVVSHVVTRHMFSSGNTGYADVSAFPGLKECSETACYPPYVL